ncbi:hypothetical protein MASR2M15_13350 [Anaerolineales bacterium]
MNPLPPSDKAVDKAEQMRMTSRKVTDILNLLRSQREMFRKRGVTLPGGSLEDLHKLKMRLDQASRQVVDAQIKLRSFRALADTTAVVNSSLKTDEVLNQVMDTVIHLTGAERGYIVLKSLETAEWEFRVARGMDQSQLEGEMIVSTTVVNQVAESGEPVLADNASMDSDFNQALSIAKLQLRSILAVPLKVREEVIGVVYCDNRILAGLFQQAELELLAAFSSQAAIAIENARLFEAVQSQLEAVLEMRDLMDNILNSIDDGVLTIDAKNHILVANHAFSVITGFPNSVVDAPLHQILPNMGEVFYAELERVRHEGIKKMIEVEAVIDGMGKRHWNIVISPLREDGQSAGGLAIVIDDLTEWKAREAQLAEVRRYLPSALVDHVNSMDDIDIGGQERVITALFADVRGFTTFSENLEPEELMRVINKYLSLASDAINLYEGIVDKYMGDAVTGLWNTQLNPQDDHANRGVQAALQLVLDLYAQHELLPLDQQLYYGIGIHTGPAVLGNLGGESRKEFNALGEATDVCKYLQEQAGPGEIIISSSTYEMVKDTFDCELCTEVVRKKKGYEHIVFYRVKRRKAGSKSHSMFVDEELLSLLRDDD